MCFPAPAPVRAKVHDKDLVKPDPVVVFTSSLKRFVTQPQKIPITAESVSAETESLEIIFLPFSFKEKQSFKKETEKTSF